MEIDQIKSDIAIPLIALVVFIIYSAFASKNKIPPSEKDKEYVLKNKKSIKLLFLVNIVIVGAILFFLFIKN